MLELNHCLKKKHSPKVSLIAVFRHLFNCLSLPTLFCLILCYMHVGVNFLSELFIFSVAVSVVIVEVS